MGWSVAEARACVARGAVYVKGRRKLDADKAILAGTTLSVVLEEGGQAWNAPQPSAPAALVVIAEDGAVLVVAKPPGQLTQPSPGRVGHSLLDAARDYLKSEPGLVHRLDKDTSGLVIFGKTPAATTALAAEFKEGRAQKTYLAAVHGELPESGTFDGPLAKDRSHPGKYRVVAHGGGVPALTDFTRLGHNGRTSTVALHPKTGRTHQLRVHLSHAGHPILGDALYGGSDAVRCLLHAWKLSILGATYEAPVPEDLAAFVTPFLR